jgi:hypothetical protein
MASNDTGRVAPFCFGVSDHLSVPRKQHTYLFLLPKGQVLKACRQIYAPVSHPGHPRINEAPGYHLTPASLVVVGSKVMTNKRSHALSTGTLYCKQHMCKMKSVFNRHAQRSPTGNRLNPGNHMAIKPVSIYKLKSKGEIHFRDHFNSHTESSKKLLTPKNLTLIKIDMNRGKRTKEGKTESGEAIEEKKEKKLFNLDKQVIQPSISNK